jgi:malate/lactate dehydrogenase
MVSRNVNVMKAIVSKLMEHNQNPILLVVSNPGM